MSIFINGVEYYYSRGILYYKDSTVIVPNNELVGLILQLSNKIEELEV